MNTTRRLELVEIARGSRELELAFGAAAELAADVLRERTGNEVLLYELLEESVVALARDAAKRTSGISPPRGSPRSDLENSLARHEAPTVVRLHASAVEAAAEADYHARVARAADTLATALKAFASIARRET